MKLIISYIGTNYYGWQKQQDFPSVQKIIEDAFKKIFNKIKTIQLTGAGRTDRGVHSIGQVANVKINKNVSLDNIIYKLNAVLPADIRILSIHQIDTDFNARYNAKKREYRYFLQYNNLNLPFFNQFIFYYPYSINLKKIYKCMKYFIGEKDFSSFSNSDKKLNPVKQVYQFNLKKKKNFIIFQIIAHSFLQGMVRNIIGTILDINKNNQNPALIKEIFRLRDNKYCGNKAPAKGLFLYKVYY